MISKSMLVIKHFKIGERPYNTGMDLTEYMNIVKYLARLVAYMVSF